MDGTRHSQSDRWEIEQSLSKLYGLTTLEATVYAAIVCMGIGREEMLQFLNKDKQSMRNILSSAKKKVRRVDSHMIFSIIRPNTSSKEIQFATEILARFYAEVTGAQYLAGPDVIILTDNKVDQTGHMDWMEDNVFSAIPIGDVKNPFDVHKRVRLMCERYNDADKNSPKMGWGVLKRKLDQMYVKMNIL